MVEESVFLDRRRGLPGTNRHSMLDVECWSRPAINLSALHAFGVLPASLFELRRDKPGLSPNKRVAFNRLCADNEALRDSLSKHPCTEGSSRCRL